MSLTPRTLVIILHILALTGCGQTGPLYLPDSSNSGDAEVKDQVKPNQDQASPKK